MRTHSHEDFATLVNNYEDDQCTPCWDVSGAALLRPSQIKNYTFGNWKSDLDIQDCLEGILKLLRLDPFIALMQQPEIDQMLTTGEAPTRWSRPRHFSDAEGGQRVDISTACGAWYSGNNHFVTFYLCADYWSIIDPLSELPGPPRRMQNILHRALRESFHARNLPVPPLPPYR
jgi:hypothetical protein